MTSCNRFKKLLNLHSSNEQIEIPDELALHIDICRSCKHQFDVGKVTLEVEWFEALSARTRKRIMEALQHESKVRRRHVVL